MSFYRLYGKRLVDLAFAGCGLAALSPIMGIVALVVRLKLGSPVLFRQRRPGLRGKPFVMFKFRTMTEARDTRGALLPDTQRLNSVGRFLRESSLDELPELFNVVRGDMSLVGPRPLLMRYNPYFTQEERIRFTVRPGITGLAQVSGRNDLSWDLRLNADVRYVRELSFWLDAQILFLTIWRVASRQGLRVDPGALMLDLDEERKTRLKDNAQSEPATRLKRD